MVIASASVGLTLSLDGGSASATPAKPVIPVAHCEGSGNTSFCHVTVDPNTGEEWLFDEDAHGTIVAILQTPPK